MSRFLLMTFFKVSNWFLLELMFKCPTLNFRSSRPEVFCKKDVLRNFAKFTGKHLCQSLFFNKVAGLRPATLLKKRLWQRCFPMNFLRFLRTPLLQNTSGGCFWTYSKPFVRLDIQNPSIFSTLSNIWAFCENSYRLYLFRQNVLC